MTSGSSNRSISGPVTLKNKQGSERPAQQLQWDTDPSPKNFAPAQQKVERMKQGKPTKSYQILLAAIVALIVPLLIPLTPAFGKVVCDQPSHWNQDEQVSDAEILKFLSGDLWPSELESRPELLAEVLRAGPLSDFSRYGKSMQILSAILQADAAVGSDPERRKTAVAVALEFTASYLNRGPDEGVARYLWYRDAQQQRRLHPSFDKLEAWERRFVVNLPWHHGTGTNDELDWLNSNVKLPPMEYTGACWQAPYRGDNPFGETVQGPRYYTPFEDILRPYEMRREVGAVCGGLSHFGAAAARANGIGATTMGEPGHCAYAIRVDGKWIPAYSLSTERGIHQSVFHNTWPYIELQEKALLKPDVNRKALRLAGQGLMAAQQDAQAGARLAIEACKVQPENPILWEIRFRLLQQGGLDQLQPWQKQARQMAATFSGYPQVVVATLKSIDQKLPPFNDAEQRIEIMTAALEEAMGPQSANSDPCNWEATFDDIYRFVGRASDTRKSLAKAVAPVVMKGPDCDRFFADSLQRFGDDPDVSTMLVNSALSREKPTGKAKDTSRKDAMARVAETGMGLAGKSRDPELFQKFVTLHPQLHQEGLAAVAPPRGLKWVSKGAAIGFSSTSRWDHLAGHAAVLSMQGGKFHTSNQDDEWAEVTLPKISLVSSIVIDNSETNRGRAVPLKVEVSEDGQNWSQVFETDEVQTQWTIDLSNAPVKARLIRIHGSIGRKDFLHLRRVLVFGVPQS